jgi:hypothetical protein
VRKSERKRRGNTPVKPKDFFLLFARGHVLKKLLRYEEANADYDHAQLVAPQPLFAVGCIIASVDLKNVAEAKERLQAAGHIISDEAIEAEMKLMYKEKQLEALKLSPLFRPVCLLMQEKKEWNGTPKQFKEILCSHSPDAFATWYRAPSKFVDELKKVTPALQEEGIRVGIPPETTLVTLTKVVMEETTTS